MLTSFNNHEFKIVQFAEMTLDGMFVDEDNPVNRGWLLFDCLRALFDDQALTQQQRDETEIIIECLNKPAKTLGWQNAILSHQIQRDIKILFKIGLILALYKHLDEIGDEFEELNELIDDVNDWSHTQVVALKIQAREPGPFTFRRMLDPNHISMIQFFVWMIAVARLFWPVSDLLKPGISVEEIHGILNRADYIGTGFQLALLRFAGEFVVLNALYWSTSYAWDSFWHHRHAQVNQDISGKVEEFLEQLENRLPVTESKKSL